jgi:uncharacterized protein YcgL (UPF0745 family)
MKLCAVYRSPKKADTYLYVMQQDDFSMVPAPLMKAFGQPHFVMMVPIGKRDTIAQLPKDAFVEKLEGEGFYLQMPPKVHSLLESHRQQQGLGEKP